MEEMKYENEDDDADVNVSVGEEGFAVSYVGRSVYPLCRR